MAWKELGDSCIGGVRSKISPRLSNGNFFGDGQGNGRSTTTNDFKSLIDISDPLDSVGSNEQDTINLMGGGKAKKYLFGEKPDFHQNTVKKKERFGTGGQEMGCELPINSYNVSEMNFFTEKPYVVNAKEQDRREFSEDFNPKHCTENLSVSFATELGSSKHRSPADEKIFLGKSLPLEKIQFSGLIPTQIRHPADPNDSNRKHFESEQDNKELLLIKKSLAIFEANIDVQQST